MTLNIAIVDDDNMYRMMLKSLLEKLAEKHHLSLNFSVFEDGSDFVMDINDDNQKYNIVFMDIVMPGLGGIEAGEQLRSKDSAAYLVYLTTSTDYMQDAFANHAFDYVVKPYKIDQIERVLMDILKNFPGAADYIVLPLSGVDTSVYIYNILAVTTDAHYLDFHMKDGTTSRCRMTLPEFLEIAGTGSPFLTINRGIVVNMESVKAYGRTMVSLEDESTYPVGMRYGAEVQKSMQNYLFGKASVKPNS